jgi:hypothetical protein
LVFMKSSASARPKLVEPSGFDSAARADLAIAIAARRAAAEALSRLEGANTGLWSAWSDATAAVQSAKDGVDQAAALATSYLIAKAVGDAGAAPVTVKAARQALTDAEDALEAARNARDGLTQQVEDATRDLALARRRVSDAALQVLREAPGLDHLVAEVTRLQRELADKGAALAWLIGKGGVSVQDVQAKRSPAALAHDRYWVPPSSWKALLQGQPGPQPWMAALAALEQDATAPLPGVK